MSVTPLGTAHVGLFFGVLIKLDSFNFGRMVELKWQQTVDDLWMNTDIKRIDLMLHFRKTGNYTKAPYTKNE